MRRLPALLFVVALVLPTACSGDDGGDEAVPTAAPFELPSVSDTDLGTDPRIVSSTRPPDEPVLRVLREGDGAKVGAEDLLVSNLKGQVWDPSGVELPAFVNSFSSDEPLIQSVGGVVPAWEKKLPGVKVGSRVLLVTPPADGFGAEGNPGVGIFPTDTLIFVIDILDAIAPGTMAAGRVLPGAADGAGGLPRVGAGKDPKVTVPKSDPPKDLTERLLIEGEGKKIEQGQSIVAQYTGVLWRDGEVFDSSWAPERGPFSARVAESDPVTGQAGVIKGWVRALVGERVGSRLLLVVPPAFGYGKAGLEDAGIKGTDTLVFVIDILGVYGKSS